MGFISEGRMYAPQKWFWIVGGDESRAWSSEAGAYVTEWDNRRVARIASEQQLSDLLRLYGLAVPCQQSTILQRQ